MKTFRLDLNDREKSQQEQEKEGGKALCLAKV